jgi:hypothetical protein
MFGPCMCSLDGSSGYCASFNQTIMDAYVDVMRDYWSRGTFCSTVDRYNMVAQSECGLGLIAPTDPLWEKAVTQNLKLTRWPYNVGEVPANCTEKYHPESYTQIK